MCWVLGLLLQQMYMLFCFFSWRGENPEFVFEDTVSPSAETTSKWKWRQTPHSQTTVAKEKPWLSEIICGSPPQWEQSCCKYLSRPIPKRDIEIVFLIFGCTLFQRYSDMAHLCSPLCHYLWRPLVALNFLLGSNNSYIFKWASLLNNLVMNLKVENKI